MYRAAHHTGTDIKQIKHSPDIGGMKWSCLPDCVIRVPATWLISIQCSNNRTEERS